MQQNTPKRVCFPLKWTKKEDMSQLKKDEEMLTRYNNNNNNNNNNFFLIKYN